MLASVETAWLFTRGSESVRIVRAAATGGLIQLLVQGPGGEREDRVFDDVVACVNYQSELERRLVRQGYVLEKFTSERRNSGDRRRISRTDRRLL